MKHRKPKKWGAKQYFLLGAGLASIALEIAACSAVIDRTVNKPAYAVAASKPAQMDEQYISRPINIAPVPQGNTEHSFEERDNAPKPQSDIEKNISLYLSEKKNVDSIKKCLDNASAFDTLISKAAIESNLDKNLIYAIIATESCGNPNARSFGDDAGLMQISPITAKELKMSLEARTNPDSVYKASGYLAKQVKRFGKEFGVAAYNWGPGNVKKAKNNYSNLSPNAKQYMTKVLSAERIAAQKWGKSYAMR